ncbi:TadE/TadG family type IV pilus assembly protein [Litorisediminicola beolgyonensis]|uniref:TadE/TadG family type IV pilus assembly protein n=1 Tax=Litorisediminicola beolgyonensis TaxID=1173614 RepID=A0ABW3ZJC2_9RHOB
MTTLCDLLQRFRRDERGSQTVEAVIWVPFFTMFLLFVVDVSMVFNRQSEMHRIVQDANRALSTGRIETTAEAESFVRTRLAYLEVTPDIRTTVDKGVINTRISVPASALMPLDGFAFFRDKTVVVSNQHLSEF